DEHAQRGLHLLDLGDAAMGEGGGGCGERDDSAAGEHRASSHRVEPARYDAEPAPRGLPYGAEAPKFSLKRVQDSEVHLTGEAEPRDAALHPVDGRLG